MWLTAQLGKAIRLEPASVDASFRRYFRVHQAGVSSLIAMDAPPEHEDCAAFVRVAELLIEAGLNAPVVRAQDLAQGFLLLSDLGTQTYLDVLTHDSADARYGEAITALVRWQQASRPGVLPAYDAALLRRELALFPQWYVARHCGTTWSASEWRSFEGVCDLLVDSALSQPQVFVHRDYMPRNLMFSDPRPGILDFQDAVVGPITYDLASLLRDAFVSWDEARVLDWSIRYWERARAADLPVDADFAEFYRAFEWMGLQRHLKVLGIFARLTYRDAKPRYLADTPRFLRYARDVALRYAPLHGLLRLFDALESRSATSGS